MEKRSVVDIKVKLDFFRTHEFLTASLAWFWLGEPGPFDFRADLEGTQLDPTIILEPCVGDGAIADVIGSVLNHKVILTNDLDPKQKAGSHLDAKGIRLYQDAEALAKKKPYLIVTNPPFSQANQIVPRMVENTGRWAAALLRQTFEEPTRERRHFLESNTPSFKITFNPRPKFRLNKDGKPGSDNVTVCWFVWDRLNPATATVPVYDYTWKKDGPERMRVLQKMAAKAYQL